MENSSSCSEEETQTLLPITMLFPPNEIITKDYKADAPVILKLVTNKACNSDPKLGCSQAGIKYGQQFEDTDTLGYTYMALMKRGLVYLKFNNKNYFAMRLKGETYKFFGGLFIPMQHLTNQTTKQYKNVYKSLKNLNFTEYSHNVPQSFGDNCVSNSCDARFSSNFETSNLFAAIKTGVRQYDLILQNDINSKGNTQWFHFAVNLPQQNATYRLSIVNFTKSSSLYEKGMRVACFSYNDHEKNKTGWFRGGDNIEYQRSQIGRQDMPTQSYYTLKFEYTSQCKDDTVVFAYSFPYSQIDLEKFFNKISYRRISSTMKIEKVKLCETLSGLPVCAYSILHKKNRGRQSRQYSQNFLKYQANSLSQTLTGFGSVKAQPRKSIVILGRQHPGQSLSSYVVQGIVQFIMESGDYDSLKKHYDFYIVPMVNVDGVFYGNYRTNLSGNDLNRMWRNPKKEYHCQVYHIKKFLFEINRQSQIAIILDIHGHSRAINSFFYGNPPKKDNLNTYQNPNFFPYFCSKRVKQISYLQSTFSVTEDKKNSARVVLSQMFPKALVYTFENSFLGWKRGQQVVEHSQESYRKVGRDLMMSYLDYVRVSQKNTALIDKWLKQIEDLALFPNKDSAATRDESDSEAQNELIAFPESQPASYEGRMQAMSGSETRRYLRKNKINSRSVQTIKSSRKCLIPMPQSSNTGQKKEVNVSQEQQKTGNADCRGRGGNKQNGFLSIMKIDRGKDQLSEGFLNKNLVLYNEREVLVQKLRRRKINLEEAISNTSGVRGFLKAMGITIEKK